MKKSNVSGKDNTESEMYASPTKIRNTEQNSRNGNNVGKIVSEVNER